MYLFTYFILYKYNKLLFSDLVFKLHITLYMTNLDSVLKSRDIPLPVKVHIVKAMVFPVVMNGCESWTIKKVEQQRTSAFEPWC